MKSIFLATVLSFAAAGATFAQTETIAERQTLLKAFGTGSREPGAMLRGEATFDIAKVKAFLATIKTSSPKLATLFPDNSFSGTTKALPIIAQQRADFTGIWTKLAADAAAAETAITNEATFKTELPKVLANCGACHRVYRGQ